MIAYRSSLLLSLAALLVVRFDAPCAAQPVTSPPPFPAAGTAESQAAEANASANRLYVSIALSVKRAAAVRDPAERLKALQEAQSRLDELAEKYPSSDLAVKVVVGDPLHMRIDDAMRRAAAEWVGAPAPGTQGPPGTPGNGAAGAAGPGGTPPMPPGGNPWQNAGFNRGSSVRDDGQFFSPAAAQRADLTLDVIQRQYGQELTIETFAEIPADVRAGYREEQKAQFFADWANRRAEAKRVNGLYVLVCKNPSFLDVISRQEAGQRGGVLPDSRDKVRDLLLERFKVKDFDGGLQRAVEFVRQALATARR